MTILEDGLARPFRWMIYGTLVAFGLIVIFTTVLAIMTQSGWTGTVQPFRDNVYMLVVYIGVIAGAVIAGRCSRANGWLTGCGVGILSSVLLIFVNRFLGAEISWGIFAVKTLISVFVGAFGGIIGVNFSR